MNLPSLRTYRLALGTGLAVLVAYGLKLTVPFLAVIIALMLLMKPGPPLPPVKGLLLAGIVGVIVSGGVLLVPLLDKMPYASVLLVALLLYHLFYWGQKNSNPLVTILVLSVTLIPVAGLTSQALALGIAAALATGLLIGIFVSLVSHAFFPEPDAPRPPVSKTAQPAPPAHWIAWRGTLIVVPVFLLALSNPAVYLPAILKAVSLGQQASTLDARRAGSELVQSTLLGVAATALFWAGLRICPSLWMYVLWSMLFAGWFGKRLVGLVPSRYSRGFWQDGLTTTFILLGPMLQDSANAPDMLLKLAMRIALFIGVALYAWLMVWLLEDWRARQIGRRAQTTIKEDVLC
ncbi:MAG: DUF2955 domain-containing protein [Thiobacillus sp.]